LSFPSWSARFAYGLPQGSADAMVARARFIDIQLHLHAPSLNVQDTIHRRHLIMMEMTI